MILRLVREQLRTQWRYTAWSAGLLAFALALATYAMVTGATALRHNDISGPFSQKEHAAVFSSIVGPGEIPEWAVVEHPVPFDEVQALIARASKETPVQAIVYGIGSVDGDRHWLTVIAATPPIDWDRQLASGKSPEHGEIVISQQIASRYGLAVGDSFEVSTVDDRGPWRYSTFVVSGIAKTGNVAPYWNGEPNVAYVPWSDAEEVALGLPQWRETDERGTETVIIVTVVSWDGDSGTLAPYDSPGEALQPDSFTWGGALGRTDGSGPRFLAAAGLAVLGMIVAAFGMGRAQAEARTTWAATARVLGASRRTIALSSIIETAIVSLAGIALGLAAGIAAVALNLAVLRATHPEALLPAGPSVPLAVLVAGVAIGLVIAAVVATVPAFWTSRVAPVAALKPVTPVGEATVSRNVSAWWLAALLGGGAVAWSVLFWFDERREHPSLGVPAALAWTAQAVVVISAAALVLEGARVLVVAVGRILSRSRRPWLAAAGDGLSARRRIFTFASLAMLVATAAFAWIATVIATQAIDTAAEYRGSGEPPLPAFGEWWSNDLPGALIAGMLVWVVGVITLVAVVVTVSSRATFARDAATRSALGLSAKGERLASGARQWAVMAAASVVGAVLGWAAALAIRLVSAALSPNELVYSWHWNVTVALWALAAAGAIVVIALGVTLAGSLVVGLLARPRTPVDALRRAAR
jgi:hypothetical protein